MVQARDIRRRLIAAGHPTEIVMMNTIGDTDKTSSFATIGPPGVFVREIEAALLEGAIDLAVHCYKDLPSVSPEGLVIAAIPGREDAREILVISEDAYDESQPGLPIKQGACIGTSAARRQAVIADKRADLICRELRGNVPTRLAKLKGTEYDAIVLAVAGVNRLGEGAALGENEAPDTSDCVVVTLDATDFVPAPSQGALALQVREPREGANQAENRRIYDIIRELHEEHAERGVRAERELLRLIQAGCEAPFGAWADTSKANEELTLYAVFAENGALRRVIETGTDPIAVASAAYRALGLAERGAG
jgi:hydroxymethylbilane synthase